MVQHSSTVVCTANQPHHILIEPRDQYHNVCSFPPGQADTSNYSISIVEVSGKEKVDLLAFPSKKIRSVLRILGVMLDLGLADVCINNKQIFLRRKKLIIVIVMKNNNWYLACFALHLSIFLSPIIPLLFGP